MDTLISSASSESLNSEVIDPLRKMIRDQCDSIRREMIDEARLMIRAEMRSVQYDSHIWLFYSYFLSFVLA